MLRLVARHQAWTFLGVLITSGTNGIQIQKSAEIYLPDTNTSCILPDFPEERNGHAQNGDLACGGSLSDTLKNCVKWTNGVWTRSHNLREGRDYHVSWATASGLYLMGGGSSLKTSELVKEDGSVEEGFDLKYDTM